MNTTDLLKLTNEELRIAEYPLTVRPLTADEGGGYLIEYPDFPGCMSDGETPEEAITNGKDALRGMILTMMEFGDPIPEPGSKMLPSDVRDRLNRIAEKRHVRPADLISEALSKMESAA
jgi:antitoxin HicB